MIVKCLLKKTLILNNKIKYKVSENLVYLFEKVRIGNLPVFLLILTAKI